MPKIDPEDAPEKRGSGYPAPFDRVSADRVKKQLGDVAGLTDFGVNLVYLPPGEWSSQRHWHEDEDEFVYLLEGLLTLVTDAGEEEMRPGDCAAFKKGVENGHHFINKGGTTAVYLEVGTRGARDVCHYPDIDLRLKRPPAKFTHKDGRPY